MQPRWFVVLDCAWISGKMVLTSELFQAHDMFFDD